MDYYRPAFSFNRPPLFQPRMEHFNLNYGPGVFHPSPPPFTLTTPAGISLYLQRPPPPPIPLPMLTAGIPYMQNHTQQHQPRDPRRQRPSRRVRQRMKRQPERLKGEEESKEENVESTPLASESGYDTTGDCHTPATPLDSPLLASGEESNLMEHATDSNKLAPAMEGGVQSRSDSASSMNLNEISLKKLLKDLHRCEVSLTKYQTMLDKNCEDGMKTLQEIFSGLRDHLNAREQSLIQKLSSVKETADSILQRRKSTASFLRQAAESSQNTLEESQTLELKHQIKCFVTDRKVDEEIGTTQCFQADPDDLLRQIMGFGKVSEARHVYTVWEENPAEMINISKEQVLFPQIRDDETSSAAQPSRPLEPETKLSDSEQESASNSVNTEDHQANNLESTSSAACDVTETAETSDLLAHPKSPKSPTLPLDPAPIQSPIQLSPPSSPAKQGSTKPTSTDRHTYSYRVSATSSIKHSPTSVLMKSGRPWYAASKVATKRPPSLPKHKDNAHIHVAHKVSESLKGNKKAVAEKEKVEQQKESSDSGSPHPEKKEAKKGEKSNRIYQRSKYSSSELQTIQLRIKDSLRQQGVYLYDPITGDGPIPTAAGGSSVGQFSSSSVDTCGERSKTGDPSTALRKKKTPTQLRRERKKRQKERERRQRELEKQQQMEHKTTKDLETESKEDEKKQSSQDKQTSPRSTNDAIADDKHTQQDTVLGELSSSDSEHNPESSSNSPIHSSSSLTKSMDNDEPLGVDPGVQNPRESLSCSGESNEEVAAIEEEPTPASTSVKSAQEEQTQEEKPSIVMLTEESRAEVKIHQQAGCQTMLTTTQKIVAMTQQESTKEGSKADGGMQDGLVELELELKPEE